MKTKAYILPILIFIGSFILLNIITGTEGVKSGLNSFYLNTYKTAFSPVFSDAGLQVRPKGDETEFRFYNTEELKIAMEEARKNRQQNVQVIPVEFTMNFANYITAMLVFLWSLILATPVKIISKLRALGLGTIIYFLVVLLGFYFTLNIVIHDSGIDLYHFGALKYNMYKFFNNLFDATGFLYFIVLIIWMGFFAKKAFENLNLKA